MLEGIILLVLGIIEVFIGIRFLVKYEKTATPIFYGLFCVGASIYVLGNAIGFLRLVEGITAERIAWTGGAIATSFFLPFSFVFPFAKYSTRLLLPLGVWPALVFAIGFLFSDIFIKDHLILSFGEGYSTNPGKFYWLFIVFFTCYWTWALVNLIKSLINSSGVHKAQLGIVVVGVGISLLGAVIFDIILPLFTPTPLGYIGSILTSAWIGATAYIVYKM